jgi:isocitrate dehydrogenase (NAD+)
LTVVRENTQGLYSSMEHWIGPGHGAAMGIGVNTRPGMVNICRYAFEYAKKQRRKKVTAVHKANILKLLSGLFLEVAQEMAPEYPEIEFEARIVDNMAMQLVMNPRQFDVIVSTNLFGDILSDLAAGLVGGLGFAPGANIGKDVAIFEAVHGSAPDIAGKDIANPVAIILAGAAMLAHMGELDASARVHRAVGDVIEDGTHVTRDINAESGVGTRAMGEAVVARLGELTG